MLRSFLTIVCLFCCLSLSQAQGLSFKSITKTENSYTAGSLVARMVEGLGFRYYWASEGLRTEDLAFSPTEGGRSSRETINHIFGLSGFLLSALEKEVFKDVSPEGMTFDQVRTATFKNLEKIVNILKKSKDSDFNNYNIRFENGGEMPFWNAVNGPISDAIYHTGQVVLMRRMSGNPINPNISVLSGSVK